MIQDFLAYRSSDPYDAIVILGVLERLPDYPAVLRQVQRLLKPGGRVYLCLHDFLCAVAMSPLEVLTVDNDRFFVLLCTPPNGTGASPRLRRLRWWLWFGPIRHCRIRQTGTAAVDVRQPLPSSHPFQCHRQDMKQTKP